MTLAYQLTSANVSLVWMWAHLLTFRLATETHLLIPPAFSSVMPTKCNAQGQKPLNFPDILQEDIQNEKCFGDKSIARHS